MKAITVNLKLLDMNCYIYFDEQSKKGVIIDPGFDDRSIYQIVEENGLDICAILLTHGHFDHIGGADSCRKKYDAMVYAHAEEASIVKNAQLNGSTYFTKKPVESTVDIKLEEGSVIQVGSGRLRVIHTPGHTCGSVCYYDEENKLLFSGDTLFYESVGRTDFATGNASELLDSLIKKLCILPEDVVVYPGHMQKTTIGHEMEANSFFNQDF